MSPNLISHLKLLMWYVNHILPSLLFKDNKACMYEQWFVHTFLFITAAKVNTNLLTYENKYL